MQNKVVVMRKRTKPTAKRVAANQKAIDALPLDSGTWRVAGVPGLYVRCRARVKSFSLERRVRGELVKRTLGEMTLKEAREESAREWGKLRPAPVGGRKTFEQAFQEYLDQKDLAAKTREIYSYNVDRYLTDWKGRALRDIGKDRAGVRGLYHAIRQKHGTATASQTIRMFSAVFRYARRADMDLPESPTVAVDLPAIKSRDWAMSPADLKAWGRAVKTLGPIKRMWWLTALLTGARRGSVEAIQWRDVDLGKKTIRFRVTKGDRPYIIPMSDKLAELLTAYRASDEVPPSEWLFPSPVNDRHLVGVRDDKRGVKSAHRLRHTFRTVLAEIGATSDQARLLMGHSMGGDVSRGYITAPLLVESLRPISNAVSQRYLEILGALEV